MFIPSVIFQCKPLALVYDKSLHGTCFDFHAITFYSAILSIVEDIVVILLPIPSILKLRLKFKKKVQVVLVMSVGLM
jgi:hypothetical protein